MTIKLKGMNRIASVASSRKSLFMAPGGSKSVKGIPCSCNQASNTCFPGLVIISLAYFLKRARIAKSANLSTLPQGSIAAISFAAGCCPGGAWLCWWKRVQIAAPGDRIPEVQASGGCPVRLRGQLPVLSVAAGDRRLNIYQNQSYGLLSSCFIRL